MSFLEVGIVDLGAELNAELEEIADSLAMKIYVVHHVEGETPAAVERTSVKRTAVEVGESIAEAEFSSVFFPEVGIDNLAGVCGIGGFSVISRITRYGKHQQTEYKAKFFHIVQIQLGI